MAHRLMTVDASREAVVITCACGFRALTPTRPMAQGIIDRHRALIHPRQATYVASKRRARADVSPGATPAA